MKQSESILGLSPDLIKALAGVHNIAPNKDGYGYKYADLASIIDMAKPVLLQNGLVVIQSVTRGNEAVAITTRIQHTSGEYIEDTFDLPATEVKGTNSVQKIGASITYGRRYGLAAILGIAVDEDTDGKINANQHSKRLPDFSLNKKAAELIAQKKEQLDETTKSSLADMIHLDRKNGGYTKVLSQAEYDQVVELLSMATEPAQEDFQDDLF